MSAPQLGRVTAAITALATGMTLLVGCATPGNFDSGSSAVPAARPAAIGDAPLPAATAPDSPDGLATLAPGMYALDRLASSKTGTTVTIRAERPCADVLNEIQAGQWTMQAVPAAQVTGNTITAVLSYGDRLALVNLAEQGAFCFGSLTVASPVDIKTSGALAASNSGIELPFVCRVGPDPGGDDPTDIRMAYAGLVVTRGGSFLVNVSAPAALGAHKLAADEDGSPAVFVFTMKPGIAPVDAALGAFELFGSGTGDSNGLSDQFTDMFGGGGTLTVTGTDPLVAILQTDTLVPQDYSDDSDEDASDSSDVSAQHSAGGKTLTLTTPLHCDQ